MINLLMLILSIIKKIRSGWTKILELDYRI
nr:MAG TPA: protein of unknown function (DUF1981) [Caudoviricetes sp.]